MVKSSDIAREYEAVEAERIQQLVRQHEADRLRKGEALPGSGILGFLAGWSFMSLLSKDRQR